MYVGIVQTLLLGKVKQCFAVIDVTVNAAVTHKTHNVQLAVVLFDVFHRAQKSGIGEEVAVGNALGDTGKFLIDNATCTHVEVTYFAVAHLTFGQTYGKTACIKRCRGIVGHKVMYVGAAFHADCVAFCLLGQTVAVHDYQCSNFFVHKKTSCIVEMPVDKTASITH